MRMQDTINHSLESGKPAKKRNHISFSDFLITKKKSRVFFFFDQTNFYK
ncbi:unnamed protein product [Brassica oleracea]